MIIDILDKFWAGSPWIVGILALLSVAWWQVYSFYFKALSEKGPGSRRIRNNLERDESRLENVYSFVLLSTRRTIEEKFGDPSSREFNVKSFDFFLKWSTLFSVGSLLVTYLLSGKNASLMQLFSEDVSNLHRGVIFLCFAVGVSLASIEIYREEKAFQSRAINTGLTLLLAATPFVIAAQASEIFYPTSASSLSDFTFFLIYLAFITSLIGTREQNGIVSLFIVQITFAAMMGAFVMAIVYVDFVGLQPEKILAKQQMEFGLEWVIESLKTVGLLPILCTFFVVPVLSVELLASGIARLQEMWSAGRCVIGLFVFSISLFVIGCAFDWPILVLATLPTFILPLVSVVHDWLSFRMAYYFAFRSNKARVADMFITPALSALVATLIMLSFAVWIGVVANAIMRTSLGSGALVLVDADTTVRLLVEEPFSPRLWWIYALVSFNLLPAFLCVFAGCFSWVSWKTPRKLVEKYSGFIRHGFKGDHPRLVETAVFLTFRQMISALAAACALIVFAFFLTRILPSLGSAVVGLVAWVWPV